MEGALVKAVTLGTVLERDYRFLNYAFLPFPLPVCLGGRPRVRLRNLENRFAVLDTATGGESDEDRQTFPPVAERVGNMSPAEKALDDTAVAEAAKAREGTRTYESKLFYHTERERKQQHPGRAFGQAGRMARICEEEGRAQ